VSELGSSPSRDSGHDRSSSSQDARRPTGRPAHGTDHASGTETIEKPAEPMTRGEYREQMRRGPSAGADAPADHIDKAGDRGEAKDLSTDRGKLAGPLTRGEYHEQIRGASAVQADRRDDHADSSIGPDGAANHASGREGAVEEPSGERDRPEGRQDRNGASQEATSQTVARNGVEEAAAGGRNKQASNESKVTHFHSEFKGEKLDIYTDGIRWATFDHPRREDMVTVKPDVPDRLPTGEELVEGAGEDVSLAERLRRELYEESDDELDVLEKQTNLAHDVFSRQPTGSYESTPANHPYISEAQQSAIDPGSMATALFTLGLVIDRGLRWGVRHYGERSKRS
jgi:hypothetical protein